MAAENVRAPGSFSGCRGGFFDLMDRIPAASAMASMLLLASFARTDFVVVSGFVLYLLRLVNHARKLQAAGFKFRVPQSHYLDFCRCWRRLELLPIAHWKTMNIPYRLATDGLSFPIQRPICAFHGCILTGKPSLHAFLYLLRFRLCGLQHFLKKTPLPLIVAETWFFLSFFRAE
jgi:hypothetical protein